MKRLAIYICLTALLITAVVPLFAAKFIMQPAARPAVDPKARATVQLMSDYLAKQNNFSVNVNTITTGILPSGERLNSSRQSTITVSRPNKLRADLYNADRSVQVYYDGNNVTMYTPRKNYYGSWSAPATLDQTAVVAAQKYGILLPNIDLLFSDPYQKLMRNVKSGEYVGETLIDGVMTHHLAFRQSRVDWQLYVLQGDKPFPKRVVITDKTVKGYPQTISTFSMWNTSPQIASNTFTFIPPAGAQRIRVAELPGARRTGAGKR